MANTNTSDNVAQYDVAIIGAGPAGSAAATYLARRNLKVLLLDRAAFPRNKICGEGLTPRCVAAIDRLGVMGQVKAAAQHIDQFRVIAPDGTTITSEIGDFEIEPKNAYMLAIPRLALDDILVKNAVASGAKLIEGCKVASIENNADGVVVEGVIDRKPKQFHAKYVVIATGANMGLLKKQGFLDKNNMPQPIIAARAYFENADHDSSVFNFHFNEVTLPGYGWIFSLPNNQVNIGVAVMQGKAVDRRDIKSLLSDFMNRPYMQNVLSGATQLGELQSYPIRTDFMTATVYKQRSLLVGEAAGLVNPLTGEGIDYAIESGELAAEHLGEILENDGTADQLAAYSAALDEKYAAIFKFSNRTTKRYLNTFMLNKIIGQSAKRASLKNALINVMLGLRAPPENMTVLKIFWKLFKYFRMKT
jgi:geranylgeranyl reductase family protein